MDPARVNYDPTRWQQGHNSFGGPVNWADPERAHLLQWATEERSICEVGCNQGQLYRALRGIGWDGRYVGLDVTPAFIEEALLKRAVGDDAGFQVWDILGQEYRVKIASAVVCSDVLQHLPELAIPMSRLFGMAERCVILSCGWAPEYRYHERDGFQNHFYPAETISAQGPEGWDCQICLWPELEKAHYRFARKG